MMLYILVERWL